MSANRRGVGCTEQSRQHYFISGHEGTQNGPYRRTRLSGGGDGARVNRMSMHASLVPALSDVCVHAPVWRGRLSLGACMRPEDLFQRRGSGGYFPPLADYIDASGDCWEWTGAMTRKGYGIAYFDGSQTMAHRAIWETLVGPIPDGLQIDHLCRNKGCVNPDHLEPVTGAVNLERGINWNRQKTHCPHGHPYSGSNLKWDRRGRRTCRACQNGWI